MPKESLNIYLAAVDGMSPVLASITDKTRALDKESQELQQTYEALQKANKTLIDRKVQLGKELKAVAAEVKETKKNFEELNDEASQDAYEKALENQRKLRSELTATNKSLQENQKIYRENIETIRKGDLGEAGGGLNGITGLGAIAAGLGVWDQVSSLAQSGASAFFSSAAGSDVGNTLSGALSGAVSGAVLGSTLVPGIGTAIGAAVGGLSGLAGGLVGQVGSKDDAFKEYYNGLYQDVNGRSGEMVSSGSTLASGRATDRISFKTLFGDEQTADSYLASMVDMANYTPFLYDDLVSMSKTLATYGYSATKAEGKGEDELDSNYILDVLQTIGDAGAALGMGTSDMNSVARALGRMKSSDKATLEYLNILNDRGIGAVGMLAEAKGVSQGDMYSMISKGSISGSEAAEIILAALARTQEEGGFRGAMEEQSKTFAGISSTLEGLEQELQNAGGDAYNTLRQSGKSDMVDAYGGELGDAIKEINAVMGENQARRENLQDQYMREVLDAVLNGNQGSLWSAFDAEQQETLTQMSQNYASLMERYQNGDTDAGAELESLYEQAQILGQAYFDNSDEMARLNDIEKEEIDAIRDAITPLETAHQRLYELNQTMSRGLVVRAIKDNYGSTIAEGKGGDVSSLTTVGGHVGLAEEKQDGYYGYNGIWHPHADGLDRVPYDDYPALLHEGERVLTASEARAQDAGGSPPIQLVITGNSFNGTSEEMADQLWEIIVHKLEQAATAAAPK